jgi:anti-sigma factor (TIGR02949 family)
VAANNINCEEALKQILAFIDHELADGEREGVERHLQACRSCFSRAEFERQLKDKLRGLASDDTPDKARDRIKALIQTF